MTRYLDRLFAGELPSVREWNEHLIAFHRAFADATSGPMTTLQTPEGLTSYDALAQTSAKVASHAHSVLDVGCGDGTLLEKVAQTHDDNIALAGMDLCDAEIERAIGRNPRAKFFCDDIAHFEPKKKFDLIVSHLVFGILPNLRETLLRLYDLLEPNGVLAFAVEDELEGAMPARLLARCVEIVRERHRGFAPHIPDRKMDDVPRILALLVECGYEKVRVERRLRVEADVEPERVWDFIVRTYPVGLLDYAMLTDLRERVIATARDWSTAGKLRIDFPLKIIVAEK